MTNHALTVLVLCSTTVLLIAYDVWIKLRQKDGNATISWVLLTAAKGYPVIAFAMGMLMGHLFWQNCMVPL